MKKFLISLILIALTGVMLPFAAYAEGEAAQSAEVYVNIINGDPMVAMKKTVVTDTDNDGILSISDALFCAHQASYPGGADAGYATETTQWGLSMVKLWGVANGGSYGYYLNNASPLSLYDAVVDGDIVSAFVYQDTTFFSDTYSYFDKGTAECNTGDEITLTLTCIQFDAASGNMVAKPAEGATVTVNGVETDYRTDANGRVTVKLQGSGEQLISAKSDLNLVAAVCVVKVADSSGSSEVPPPTVTGPADDNGSYGWIIAICAAVIVAVFSVALIASQKYRRNK
ncbi:MAG: hypothetical protein IKB34_07875 [Clostridia bacterium]|nr:hypothetical protein [Clostridia bacterium]